MHRISVGWASREVGPDPAGDCRDGDVRTATGGAPGWPWPRRDDATCRVDAPRRAGRPVYARGQPQPATGRTTPVLRASNTDGTGHRPGAGTGRLRYSRCGSHHTGLGPQPHATSADGLCHGAGAGRLGARRAFAERGADGRRRSRAAGRGGLLLSSAQQSPRCTVERAFPWARHRHFGRSSGRRKPDIGLQRLGKGRARTHPARAVADGLRSLRHRPRTGVRPFPPRSLPLRHGALPVGKLLPLTPQRSVNFNSIRRFRCRASGVPDGSTGRYSPNPVAARRCGGTPRRSIM